MFPPRTLTATLAKAAWRGWCAKPFLALLNVLGLAIGIAVYLAIQIVNHSATRSFQAGIDLVAGRSDLEITALDAVDETLLQDLSGFPGILAASPILEGYATLPDKPGEYLRIIGVDPFSAGPFFEAADNGAAGAWQGSTEAWLARPAAITVNAAWAERFGLTTGSTLALSINGQAVPVTLAGTFPSPEGRTDALRTAFLDLGWAQELLGKAGFLTSIQIIAADPVQAPALAAAIQKRLPSGTQVQPPAQRNRQVSLMLQGFQLNLTALSMVSLLVGVFLIGNTIAASVVRQRREIGVLRAIGASRTQVRTVFMAEAAFSALIGGLLGIPLARLIAASLLDGVSQTISAHYILLSIDKTWVSPVHVIQALLCGLLAALVGAWLPAREASAVDPVAVLRPGRNIEPAVIKWWKPLGPAVVFLTLAVWLSFQSLRTGPAWLSFASCLCLVLGFVLLARPTATAAAWIAESASRALPSLTLFRMGASHLARALHRAVPVIAALLTSVAMVLGVTIMIHSFRSTITLWVGSSLKADLYIGPAANEVIRRSATLPDNLAAFLQNHPAVRSLETLFEDRTALPDGTNYNLRAINRPATEPLAFISGDAVAQDALWRQPGHVAVSEVLANRLHLTPGQSLILTTPTGSQPFVIAGIFYDYSDDQGCFHITQENYRRSWSSTALHGIAVALKDPATAAPLEAEIRRTFSTGGGLAIYLNQALRTRVYEVFDQTFAVTHLLRVIAIAVALLGITLALSTLVAERSWDIAALRSIGASRWQIAIIHLTEAGLIGLVSAILGMISGLLLSMILTWVVNKAFFGWTVNYQVPWTEWALTPLWVTATALIAGLIPAWKAAGTNLSTALRSE
jgi:putative ABC transport system permease protein